MAYELIYMSVPRGLRPGTSGFCTVAHTAGMPSALIREIEALSAHSPAAGGAGSPVQSHYYLPGAHGGVHVLSRITAAGLDHTRRPNKLAHHIVLKANDLPPAGPAWLLRSAGTFVDHWSGRPRVLHEPPNLPPAPEESPRPCVAWQNATGDAGWGGIVAGALLDRLTAADRAALAPFHVIVPRSLDPMPLIGEVLAILPAAMRWKVTFSSRFVQPQPPGALACHLRFVPVGSEAARALSIAGERRSTLEISPAASLPAPPQSQDAECARAGRILRTGE